MAKKVKEVENPQEAFELLGINEQVTDPEGNPVTTEPVPPSEEVQPAKAPASDTSEPAIEFAEEETEQQPEKPQEIPEEEQKRRTWQAEADKAKAELTQTQEQIRLLQAQNQQLVATIAPFQQKYGVEQQQAQPQTNGEPEPDFIEEGYFEPKKFAEYQRKHAAWQEQQITQKVTTSLQQQQEQATLQQQLNTLAQEFPEYVNPLTGQVDTERVHRDLQAYTSKKTVVDLIREAKGIKPKADADTLQKSLTAIEKNADRPQPVTASRETEKEKITVPKKLKELHDQYGNLELPPDFDGLID
jgi:hypothetical protein